MVASSLLFVAACVATAVSGDQVATGDECSLMNQIRVLRQSPDRVMSFSEFIAQHRRTYLPDSEEYAMRSALFEARSATVREQNSDTSRVWTAGINKLSDRTLDELKAIRGYNRHHRASSSTGSAASGSASSSVALAEFGKPIRARHGAPRAWKHFAEKHKHHEPKLVAQKHSAKGDVELPPNFDWVSQLSSLSQVRDQGGCGSCWAFAAGTVLRAQSEIHTDRRDFSYQEIVDCVPNPEHCGGDGGCSGATVELAMEYVLKYGSYNEQQLPYTGVDGQCTSASQQSLAQHDSQNKGEAYGMTGWVRLPENQLQPVKQALVQNGPLGVAIMVGDLFQMYMSGILPACQPEALINHAVTLVGFGEDKATSTKFWRIQNSWGADWGENGYIRIHRHEDQVENDYCGWDNQPEDGSGCDGGPSRVWVCGTCGILNDVVSPIFSGGPGHESHSETSDVVLIQADAVSKH